ncbi:MAG: four helix bundle protein [Candidatus Aenigmatarchaeota archaeon]
MKGEEMKKDIIYRCFKYAVRIVKFYEGIEKSGAGRIIGKQLLRSGTSIGANVNEAQSGQSKADFISKMYIAYKEARETVYWLKLIKESGIHNDTTELTKEAEELVKILASIIKSAKNTKC